MPAKLKDSIPQMEEMGLTVLAVKPENQADLFGAIELLAQATNTTARGEELEMAIDSNLAALAEAVAGTDAPSVYLAGNSSVLETAGSAMYQNTMIENANGTNAAASVEDTYWAEVSYEQILDWNPDYIILASDAEYDVDSVLNDAALADCTAVKESHVYQLPHAVEAVDSPVPASFLGSVYLASVLHPEQVTEEYYHAAADEFYGSFYGFTPNLMNNNRKRTALCLLGATLCVFMAFGAALYFGRYPITLQALLAGDAMAVRTFTVLRLPRAVMALAGGFGLGVAGFVYQTVFRNPLASPDIIGVSSGASVGAAFAILFVSSGTLGTTVCAFAGGLAAVFLSLGLAAAAPGRSKMNLVLAGIAVHALAQTLLMLLKLTADPEKELASIEYWIMGSLAGVTQSRVWFPVPMAISCCAVIFALHRQAMLLSVEEDEARLLGVPVGRMRFLLLTLATLVVAAVVSVTGLISFVGCWPPTVRGCWRGTTAAPPACSAGWWAARCCWRRIPLPKRWRQPNCRSVSSPRCWVFRFCSTLL